MRWPSQWQDFPSHLWPTQVSNFRISWRCPSPNMFLNALGKGVTPETQTVAAWSTKILPSKAFQFKWPQVTALATVSTIVCHRMPIFHLLISTGSLLSSYLPRQITYPRPPVPSQGPLQTILCQALYKFPSCLCQLFVLAIFIKIRHLQ